MCLLLSKKKHITKHDMGRRLESAVWTFAGDILVNPPIGPLQMK